LPKNVIQALITSTFRCWLTTENGVIWSFAGPVVFVVMVRSRRKTRNDYWSHITPKLICSP